MHLKHINSSLGDAVVSVPVSGLGSLGLSSGSDHRHAFLGKTPHSPTLQPGMQMSRKLLPKPNKVLKVGLNSTHGE